MSAKLELFQNAGHSHPGYLCFGLYSEMMLSAFFRLKETVQALNINFRKTRVFFLSRHIFIRDIYDRLIFIKKSFFFQSFFDEKNKNKTQMQISAKNEVFSVVGRFDLSFSVRGLFSEGTFHQIRETFSKILKFMS